MVGYTWDLSGAQPGDYLVTIKARPSWYQKPGWNDTRTVRVTVNGCPGGSGGPGNSGTARVRVVDSKGEPISGALVRLVNEETGNLRSSRTSDGGYATIPFLRPGFYSVTASKEGYLPQSYKRFPVQINATNETIIRLGRE
jgi:hypothetical protein